MAVDEKYSSIILKRISDSQNPSEQVELISDDNQRIPIHRVILTAASKYFAALLGPNWNSQEGKREEGEWLEGTNGETLRMIVNYCYTGHIKLTEENVQSLLTVASMYQLDLLEEKCCLFYTGILSVTNSVEALMIAEKLNYAELRRTALDFILEHFESVSTADAQKLNHQLLQEILQSDKITSSEELIFDRLLRWSEHEEKERKPYLPNLLKLIRLQHIKLEILEDTVEAFYKKFECIELMLAEYRRRASGNHFDSGFRRFPPIFCLFTTDKNINGQEHSVIKVGRFETKSRSWEEIAEFTLGEREDFTVVLNQNKIYALGGKVNYVPCNTVSSFDLNSHREEILPNMSISREDCTSISFGEYIYVFGGFNTDSGYLSSCERFDKKRKIWTEIESMNIKRAEASAVVMNECIYIAGGEEDDDDTITFESYDPMRNIWTVLAPTNNHRWAFALIQSNGFIYAIGGSDYIEKYDPSKNEWTEFPSQFQISHLDDSSRITSGINVNGEIYVMKHKGEFTRIKIDESDNCSFLPWVVETEYKSEWMGRHFLSLN